MLSNEQYTLGKLKFIFMHYNVLSGLRGYCKLMFVKGLTFQALLFEQPWHLFDVNKQTNKQQTDREPC